MSEIREHPGLGLNQEGLLRLEKIAESGGVVSSYWVTRMADEIRRLREVNRKRNHCVECGNLNPVDNVCDGCYQQIELGK